METLPIYIKPKSNNLSIIKGKLILNNLNKIPKIVIQTFNTNIVHRKIYDNTKKVLNINKNYEYRLITDEIGIKLISDNFDDNVMSAFNKLNIGAAKGDFLRYIALYVYGGIYIDLDSSIITNLDYFLDYNCDFYFFYDKENLIVNTPIITKPNNHILLKIIIEVVKRIHNNETNIFLATGPYMITDIIYNIITNNNVYNTKDNIQSIVRKNIWINNKNYKNGNILYVHDNLYKNCFRFKFQNYIDKLLYPNNNKYICTYNTSTPNLYK